ncbi:MAG: DegV family protein [Peptococcaceae bacterium]|nr:DegV family protein [Peptococcaceae bacterium]
MNVAIVTDSTADIPQHLVDALNIKVIPLAVHFGGRAYLDRIDISNDAFYEYIGTAKTLPTTSQPSPAQYMDVYRACKAEGAEKIISIHLSSEMSGTYQGALLAADMVKDEVDVTVIDSRTVTIGLGLMVVLLAQYVQNHQDVTWEALRAHIDDMTKKMRIYFLLDTLDNLQKGGRIGKASYLVGSILNIKPILVVEDGFIGAHEKVRGKKIEKAIEHLSNTVVAMMEPNKKLYYTLGTNNDDYLQLFEKSLLPKLAAHQLGEVERLPNFELGCVVTTHIGLGGFGIAFYQE